MQGRTRDPYRDTDVIDSRGPRTNQGVIGVLSLLAFVLDLKWLAALLALPLPAGLSPLVARPPRGGLPAGRRYCLPGLLWFEVLQPRFGEGRIEDARPPRFANMVGFVFLTAATLLFVAGATTAGWTLTLIVAALALLAATSGICVGCEMYLW